MSPVTAEPKTNFAQTGPSGRSPIAYLLHALNQPLTGLQCSLELGLIGPRTLDQHVQSLRDGLELTARMRVLVGALRELVDVQAATGERKVMGIAALLQAAVDELSPVAATRKVGVVLEGDSSLAIRAEPHMLSGIAFRLLEAALSRAAQGSTLRIVIRAEDETVQVQVRWEEPGNAIARHPPFSPAELGLLIAQTGWERAGAEWRAERNENEETISIHMPRAREVAPR